MSTNYKKISKFTVHAFLKTTSPLSIPDGIASRYDPTTGQVVYGDKSVGIGCTTTQKTPVVCPGAERNPRVATIPANNVIGHLRRKAAEMVLDTILARKEQLDIQTLSCLLCGAFTGNPDSKDVTFAEYREARDHPYLGLFGGGPRMMPRHVRLYSLVPMMKETEYMFSGRKHPFIDEQHIFTGNPRDLLYRWISIRNDDLKKLEYPAQAHQTVRDFEEKLLERQKKILEAKKETDALRHSTHSFSAYEFVIPGVVFPMVFELDVTDEQLGLFFLALDAFAAHDHIGASARNGLGAFVLNDVLLCDENKSIIAKGLFNDSRLNRDNPVIAEYLKKWGMAAASFNAADLDRLLSAPEPEKTKKGKEKAEG